MIVHGENRYCTAIKNISRVLTSLNANHKGAYNFFINYLNGFIAASARDKHCRNNGHVKVKRPSEKEKWLKLHNEQHQFMVPFMLYRDFESVLKTRKRPV